ncbi:MAG: hypothetical protein EXR69_06620 [Myxococcales bacterium]|nr:hypothetical protein [Myxococcales bacterium]
MQIWREPEHPVLPLPMRSPSLLSAGWGVAIVALHGCTPKSVSLDGLDSADSGTPVTPLPAIHVTGGALDPLRGTECPLDVTAANGSTVRLTIADGAGTVLRTLADGTTMLDATSWDGRDAAGVLAPVGTYSVKAELLDLEGAVLASAASSFYIVRVGVIGGTLGGTLGDGPARVPMIWHRGNNVPGNYWLEDGDDPTFQIEAIDDGSTATALPALWEDLDAPPETHVGWVLPAAYPYDATPSLGLEIDGAFGAAAVQLTVAGWGAAQNVAPGDLAQYTSDAQVATGPSVVEQDLTLSWTVDTGDGGAPVTVGTQTLPLRLYALLRAPEFEMEGLPYAPWVAAIDPALRALDGVEGTDDAVTAALTEWVYRDFGLAYDTQYGASAYTAYAGRGYNNAEFDFTGFLDRTNGSTVNCSDCASILEAYADMLGADLKYTIILRNYDLNYIKAIGGEDYTHCPFGAGGCGFSYHAVTTSNDAATIYDATLALDGDEDPGSGPFTELLVQNIDGAEYLERLVMSGTATYNFTQKESLR